MKNWDLVSCIVYKRAVKDALHAVHCSRWHFVLGFCLVEAVRAELLINRVWVRYSSVSSIACCYNIKKSIFRFFSLMFISLIQIILLLVLSNSLPDGIFFFVWLCFFVFILTNIYQILCWAFIFILYFNPNSTCCQCLVNKRPCIFCVWWENANLKEEEDNVLSSCRQLLLHMLF